MIQALTDIGEATSPILDFNADELIIECQTILDLFRPLAAGLEPKNDPNSKLQNWYGQVLIMSGQYPSAPALKQINK